MLSHLDINRFTITTSITLRQSMLQAAALPAAGTAGPALHPEAALGLGMDDVTTHTADAYGDINAMFQGALASEAPWQVLQRKI